MLKKRAKDRPEKTLSIEIYNCLDFQRMRLHWNGCGLILHELCHVIHQHTFPAGLENIQIKHAFALATKSGRYEQVLRRDWAGKDIDCDMAYAMVDHREFFAEMSVTYWSRGYENLDSEVHSKMERVSPPILSPCVKERVAQRSNISIGASSSQGRQVFPIGWWARPRIPHCNKFYPFTRGQLQSYDGDTFRAIDNLWYEISMWDDPSVEDRCIGCWHPRRWKRTQVIEVECSDTVDL
jgi:hypothetical protein